MNKEQEYEDYLDEKFPKGKDKRRGEALVVGALGIIKGRQEEREKIIGIIPKCIERGQFNMAYFKSLIKEGAK